MKEFMLQFKEGQEYLITARKLRWVYEHAPTNPKYAKRVDRELTVRQFEIIRQNPDNGYYCFYYNGALIHDFTIDTHSDRYLVILKIDQGFPGYEPGHTALSKTPYDAREKGFERRELKGKFVRINPGVLGTMHLADPQTQDTPLAGQSHSNDTAASGISDRHSQQPHPAFQPTSEHVRRSESLMSKEETLLSYVDLLIRESIRVIPLENVRIGKPAVVLVKVPETGEESRYMMTLSPIAR